jgi:hypothetical protein
MQHFAVAAKPGRGGGVSIMRLWNNGDMIPGASFLSLLLVTNDDFVARSYSGILQCMSCDRNYAVITQSPVTIIAIPLEKNDECAVQCTRDIALAAP